MSGKGDGKKHNRAAQSQQHGFQESPEAAATRPERERGRAAAESGGEKERVLDKLRRLEEERRQAEASQEASQRAAQAGAEEAGGAEAAEKEAQEGES